MGRELREVRDDDLPVLFEQWADPVAMHMAAFTSPEHMNRDAFERRWSRLRADETVRHLALAGLAPGPDRSGDVAVDDDDAREQLDRPLLLGQRIATDALDAFLKVERARPLHARVASDNVASRRVLEKCGFGVIATERNVAEARSSEIEELVLRLDELASTE